MSQAPGPKAFRKQRTRAVRKYLRELHQAGKLKDLMRALQARKERSCPPSPSP